MARGDTSLEIASYAVLWLTAVPPVTGQKHYFYFQSRKKIRFTSTSEGQVQPEGIVTEGKKI